MNGPVGRESSLSLSLALSHSCSSESGLFIFFSLCSLNASHGPLFTAANCPLQDQEPRHETRTCERVILLRLQTRAIRYNTAPLAIDLPQLCGDLWCIIDETKPPTWLEARGHNNTASAADAPVRLVWFR